VLEISRKLQVAIRPPERRDCSDFLAAVHRSRSLHAGWVSPPKSPREFAQYLKRVSTEAHRAFLVIDDETGSMVGIININNIIRGNFQSAFLGYYAFSPYLGQGLMTQGLKLVLRFAFRKLKLHRLEANIQPHNQASISLVRKCGFVREGCSVRYLKVCGRWRDHERWATRAETSATKVGH